MTYNSAMSHYNGAIVCFYERKLFRSTENHLNEMNER